MKIRISKVSRLTYGLAALALTLAIGADTIVPGLVAQASAAQVTSRSIKMSDSNASAGSVKYQVGFTAPSNATIKGIVVDFCDGSPIIGDSCSAPAGFSLGTPTVDTSTVPNTGLTGTWTVATANTARTLELTNATGTALNNTAVIFTVSGITNPNTSNHSFYARILTYTTTAGATSYAAGTEGAYTDYGGVALSTGTVINITARVMETLSFCVYAAAGVCNTNDPSITIGHTVGSAVIIDNNNIDTADVNFSLATNAQSGAAVNIKGDTLKSGSNDINAPASATTATTFAAGTENFGVRVSTSGTNITAAGPYNGGANAYGFYTSATDGTTSTYGDLLCTLSGPTNSSISTLTFAATAGNTTPAGTYTASEQLIATGTF